MPREKRPLTVFGADRLPTQFCEEFFKRNPEFRRFDNSTTVGFLMAVLVDPELIHSKTRLPGTAKLKRLFCDLFAEAPDFVVRFSDYFQRHLQKMPLIERFLVWNPIVVRPSGTGVSINHLTDGEIALIIHKRFQKTVTAEAVKKARQKLALTEPDRSEVVTDRRKVVGWSL